MSEAWPDPDDVATWLASLDERIKILDDERAAVLAHRDECRRAVDRSCDDPSGDASKRVCLMMHGVLLAPCELEEEDVLLCEPLWTPPTDDEKRDLAIQRNAEIYARTVAEERRRSMLAMKHFGMSVVP